MPPHSASPRASSQPVNPFELNRRVIASDLSHAAKLVLLAILDHAGHGRSTCWASNRTLARETGVAERHVRRVISDIAARGLVRIERATGSVHSRRTIALGPYMHQVGHEIRLRLHEVGHDDRPGRTSGPAEVGRDGRQTAPDRPHENGSSLLEWEGLDPDARRLFARFLPPS